jgi:hypothetical protein
MLHRHNLQKNYPVGLGLISIIDPWLEYTPFLEFLEEWIVGVD